MKKLPYLPLYTGDWLKEPALSVCMPSTRGIWIDLLCAMHEQGQSGELRGTSVQIARLARCTTAELEEALSDLQNFRAAEVQNRGGSWTIANRRMKRAADLRGKRVEAGSKGGSKTQANGREGCPIYESEDEGVLKVREFARGEGITRMDAEWFFFKCHANGWTNGGKPILDWKATLRSWQRARYLPSQKQTKPSAFQAISPTIKKPRIVEPLPLELTDEQIKKNKAVIAEATGQLREKLKMGVAT